MCRRGTVSLTTVGVDVRVLGVNHQFGNVVAVGKLKGPRDAGDVPHKRSELIVGNVVAVVVPLDVLIIISKACMLQVVVPLQWR